MTLIAERNRKITITPYATTTQDEGGSPVAVAGTPFIVWAKVEDRSGGFNTSNGQQTWGYDYKITFLYEPSRVVKSSALITYDGKTLKINSLSYESEGSRKYNVCRCSTTDII